MHKRVTIKDVALKAGVSIGAVSRVLHGRASTIRVSEPTAEIIRQAAIDLQYKPNRSAQSLRSGRTKALTIAAPFDFALARNSYYASLVDCIISHAGEKGYTICLSKSSMSKSVAFEDSKGKFDGVIWLGAPKNIAEDESARVHGTPQVGVHLIDSDLPEAVLNVKADEIQAILNYVGHLRVNDVTKIGLFAKEGETNGLMSESNLKDLCKRLAIQFFSFKSLDGIPDMVQKSDVEAGVVWHLSDVHALSDMMKVIAKGPRKVEVCAVVTDADKSASKIPGKHFALPMNEMCKSAVELLISKIENPQAVTTSIALTIPMPS